MKVMPKIDGYTYVALLGQGGMGQVHLAKRDSDSRMVAIKYVRGDHEFTDSQRLCARLKREVDIAKTFAHPYVVQILDGGFNEEQVPFIVMEFLEGESLAEVVSEKLLNSKELMQLALQMSEALSYIHSHDIIHRDVKPSNIHIVSEERAVLLDFGLALDSDATRLTETDERLGTLLAMAPEQLIGLPIDCRADIYGLGVSLYVCATGQYPFNREEILRMAIDGSSEPLIKPCELRPTLTKKLQDVIIKCLAYEREERYSSAEELKSALLEAGEKKPKPQAVTKVIEIADLKSKERKTSYLVAIFCLIVCLLLLFTRSNPKNREVLSVSRGELSLVAKELTVKTTLPTKEELTTLGSTVLLLDDPNFVLTPQNAYETMKKTPHLLLPQRAPKAAKGLIYLIDYTTKHKAITKSADLALHFARTYSEFIIDKPLLTKWIFYVAEQGKKVFELAKLYAQFARESKNESSKLNNIKKSAHGLSYTFHLKLKSRELLIQKGIREICEDLLKLLGEYESPTNNVSITLNELTLAHLRLLYILDSQKSKEKVRHIINKWLLLRPTPEKETEPLLWAARALTLEHDKSPTRIDREQAAHWLELAGKMGTGKERLRALCILAKLKNSLGDQKRAIAIFKSIDPAELPRDLLDDYFMGLGDSHDMLRQYDKASAAYLLGLKYDDRVWWHSRYRDRARRSSGLWLIGKKNRKTK